MKTVSKINGLVLEATTSTLEVLKMGNGSIAKAVPDSKFADPLEDDEVTFADDNDESDEDDNADSKSKSKTTSKSTTAKKTTTRKTTTRKPAAKKTTSKKATDEEIEQTKAEAAKLGVKLTDNQIDGANEHDLDDDEDEAGKGEDKIVKL